MIKHKKNNSKKQPTVTLKAVAEYVGLTPGTVSVVLNKTASSKSIPQRTKDRIFAAAAKLNYQPNFLARSLRTGQLHTAAFFTDDARSACGALVVASADHLRRAIHAIQSAGLRVPDDVSVLGFDDIPMAFARPVLAAGQQPP
jgi:DNA-binding LacI/PurR family transcriptional regulator